MSQKPKRRIVSGIDPKYEQKDWRTAKLRTAGYVRVSTDSNDQENSLKNQREYYEEFIPQNPNWEYVGIYADEGISGTSIHNRTDFLRMIEDCKAGKIDLIVVKDVSRFARNIKDFMSTVEVLSELDPPVGVFFEKNNLNTLDVGTKILLTILAMLAELESELKSKSVEFGLNVIFNRGDYPCPTNLLGYVKDGKYGLKIEPKGARTVGLIYDLFLAGYRLKEVARILTGLMLPTAKGNLQWSKTAVAGILKNEKFFGAIVMRKRFTPNFKTHKTKQNIGQKQLYYETQHHEAIVSEEEHTRALLLLEADQDSPYYNHLYEIKVIRQGLLSGFFPMNAVFGGYDPGHYLGAFVMARVPQMNFETQVAHIAGARRVRSELFSDRDTAMLTLSRRGFVFSAGCVSMIDTAYVEILLHPNERLLAVRKTGKHNKNAIPWSNEAVFARELSSVLFELMGWQDHWVVKIAATYFEKNSEQVILFDLNNCELRSKNVRAVPGEWLSAFGNGLPEYMMLCRRALANQLTYWDVGAVPAEVEYFDFGFLPLSRTEAEQRIVEMRG